MRLFDNLTRMYKNLTKKTLIKVYWCGPTVYNHCHLGHGRSFVTSDLLHRVLLKFYDVQFVQNITDIAESIHTKAQEEGCSTQDIVNKYEASFLQDIKLLNILPVIRVKASSFIPSIIKYIQVLIDNKHAYLKEDGVYFAINHFNYDLFECRKNEVDFALWKFRDSGFNSPWGVGIPGWHIECSAMYGELLGDEIDIHGGGCDLQFPHHQNEIIQSWGLKNTTKLNKFSGLPVNIWIHNNMLLINGVKMSKSLGNSIRLNDLVVNEYTADVFRYMVLKTHYSKNISMDDDEWEKCMHEMNIIRLFYFKNINREISINDNNVSILADDLNSGLFLTTLMSAMNENWMLAMNMIDLLGFNMKIRTSLTFNEIEVCIKKRLEFRSKKMYEKADQVRRDLSNQHVAIEDCGAETIWYYK
jgi:cysteinyl-tRNA synthetase